MAKVVYVPERGDVVILDFNPTKGHEQAGRRPALVISPRVYNHVSGLIICCPVTSTKRNRPFEVGLPKSMITRGVVLVEQVRSLAWSARNVSFVERVPSSILDEVKGKLIVLIDPEMGL